MTQAGGMKIKEVNQFIVPSQLRQDQQLPQFKIIVYSDGKTGWVSSPQGVQPMPPPILKQAQGEIFRNLLHLMLADRDPALKVNGVKPNAIEITGGDGMVVRLEFDESSGLPLKESYVETAGGQNASTEESFSDYREAGGVKVPFKIVISQNKQEQASVTVQDYKFNSGLKAEDLSKKP